MNLSPLLWDVGLTLATSCPREEEDLVLLRFLRHNAWEVELTRAQVRLLAVLCSRRAVTELGCLYNFFRVQGLACLAVFDWSGRLLTNATHVCVCLFLGFSGDFCLSSTPPPRPVTCWTHLLDPVHGYLLFFGFVLPQ